MKAIVSMALFTIGIAWLLAGYKSRDSQPRLTEVPDKVYDYIVGAGSAGSVVASRLSEDPNVTVLLVEAGRDDRGDDRVLTPALFASLMDSMWHVDFETRGKNSNPEIDRVVMRSGMLMGGSSSVNIQVYARGSRHDFDLWAKITKDKTWNYAHVLPYFKKSEGVSDPALTNSSYHGKDGPLSVSTHKNGWPIFDTAMKAFRELGFEENEDYNGESMTGVSHTQYNTANGERVSCSRAFLHNVLERPNLHVTVNSFVQKVLIRDNKAYGIEMVKNMQKFKIIASKEIILSAGAIHSPKILMLSGIGPKDSLSRLGIPVIKDLPVGNNLQNHQLTDVSFSVESPVTGSLEPSFLSYLRYSIFKSGSLATSDADVVLFTNTSKEAGEKQWPDLQIILLGKPLVSPIMSMFVSNENIVKELAAMRDVHRYGFGCFPSVLRPESRGTLSIVSSDPFDLPNIRTNFMDAREDINVLIRGIRICQSLVNTTAMKSVGASFTDWIPLSVCKDHIFDSDDYWKCYIQKKPMIHYHPVGTCKMGSDDDLTAVLDSKLRVKGIKALRVVDASVMPTIVSANTHAATVMIGEKAADIIRQEQ